MITIQTKESSNTMFYKGIIKYLESDNFVKTFKDIFKSRDFKSSLGYNRKFFTAPIENLSYSNCRHKDGTPLQKSCFKLKEEFKLSFIIYKIMMDVLDVGGNDAFLNKTLQGLSDSPLFPEDFALTNIIKQNRGTALSLLQWKKKLFYSSRLNTNYKYTNYLMYFDGMGLREMFGVELGEFLADLYYSEKGFQLIQNPLDKYHNSFKFTNLTEFNNTTLKGSEEIYLNLFTKLAPYYYAYVTGIVSEKDFLSVFISEMKSYILAQLKYRISKGLKIKKKQSHINYYLRYLKFGERKFPKFTIVEFSENEQKHILKLLQDKNNSQAYFGNIELSMFLENKFKRE
jgi:hypothetical protein